MYDTCWCGSATPHGKTYPSGLKPNVAGREYRVGDRYQPDGHLCQTFTNTVWSFNVRLSSIECAHNSTIPKFPSEKLIRLDLVAAIAVQRYSSSLRSESHPSKPIFLLTSLHVHSQPAWQGTRVPLANFKPLWNANRQIRAEITTPGVFSATATTPR